ncbi:MAG: aminomethyl transferase family protein [Phycisphaerae bacterium]|nr:hypothetical protein [Phycisphaerae bacterium]NUQ47434.1 aminomethyl transferase family protein [Phycisphaerae bacterium]
MPPAPDRLKADYDRARNAVALLERTDRGLIEAAGPDRAAWLNNLVTNVVKTLGPGDGNYAFAVNVKGRVIFDMNILVLDDLALPEGRLWLDIDAGWITDAMKHLDRHIITENVTLTDRIRDFHRWALLGPRAAAVVERLGFGNLVPMAQLQHVEHPFDGGTVRAVRHDFAGVPGVELLVSAAASDALRQRLIECGSNDNIAPIDPAAVHILRVEAGIPASRIDIDAEVIPPETSQIERGINYKKGCYLGQEVIERMRSRGMLPRQLVGVRLSGRAVPALPLSLSRDGNDLGRVTTVVWSFALDAPLALAYVKSAHAAPGTKLTATSAEGTALDGQIVAFPLRASSS